MGNETGIITGLTAARLGKDLSLNFPFLKVQGTISLMQTTYVWSKPSRHYASKSITFLNGQVYILSPSVGQLLIFLWKSIFELPSWMAKSIFWAPPFASSWYFCDSLYPIYLPEWPGLYSELLRWPVLDISVLVYILITFLNGQVYILSPSVGQLLIFLCCLIKQLNKECTCLLVFTTPYCR